MIVVSDAGPLIALAKVNALDVLLDLCGVVQTAGAVYKEVVESGRAIGAEDVARLAPAFENGRLRVVEVTIARDLMNPALGAGELESIQLALERRADWLLMDERRARRVAVELFAKRQMATVVKGTLGVIATAVEGRQLERARAIEIVVALQARPDVWISGPLCERMLQVLHGA